MTENVGEEVVGWGNRGCVAELGDSIRDALTHLGEGTCQSPGWHGDSGSGRWPSSPPHDPCGTSQRSLCSWEHNTFMLVVKRMTVKKFSRTIWEQINSGPRSKLLQCPVCFFIWVEELPSFWDCSYHCTFLAYFGIWVEEIFHLAEVGFHISQGLHFPSLCEMICLRSIFDFWFRC